MADYEQSTYGDRIAAVYDQFHSHSPVTRFTDATVEFLASIAGNRRVLELGIGSGRIAVPLAAKGLKVFGIDASEKMVEKMREKPGGDTMPVVFGNFDDVKISGHFSLIYVVFSTFFALLTQEEQIRCLQRVARHLTAEGAFVMEAFVPDPSRFDRGQRVGALDVDTDRVRLEGRWSLEPEAISFHIPITSKPARWAKARRSRSRM
jgi:SAM-dependent methyltransferase